MKQTPDRKPVTQLERERKYEAEAGTALPELAGADPLPGIARAVPAVTERLDAVYYDTAELRLLRRRITLRRRTGGHDAGWHLKLPATDGARLELRVPLGDEPADGKGAGPEIPAELLARVRAYVREAPLRPIARLRNERRRTLLEDADGRLAVELAEDSVTAEALDAEGAVRDAESWQEVEAELGEDAPDALLELVEARLLDAGLRRSASSSKLARTIGTVSPLPAVGRSGSVGALLGALLRQQVDALLALDAQVRQDEPDAVHQMRIAARRLRSTLRVHARLLRQEGLVELEEELRRLGHVLGAARDREVLGDRLLGDLESLSPADLPPGTRPGQLRRRIGAWRRRGYTAAWRGALAELDGARYLALLEALEALATDPPLRKRAKRPVEPELRRLLRRERGRACRRLADALELPDGEPRDLALHAARRAAKRARYAGEGAARPDFARAMKAIQSTLGDRQDALLAAQALPELAQAATAAHQSAFGYGVLHAHERAAVLAAEAELPALLAAAREAPVR